MYIKPEKRLEYFENRLKEKYPNEDLTIIEYNGSTEPAVIKCNKCGHEYKLTKGQYFLVKKTKVCSNCIKRQDTREVGNKVKYLFKHNNNIELLNEYTKITDNLKIKCKKCGSIFERMPRIFLKSQLCPYCETFSKFKTKEVFEQELLNKLSREYTLLGEYKGTNEKTLFRHNDCGFIFENSPHGILQKQPCPKCKRFNSKGEIKINKILTEHNIIFETQKHYPELELLSFDFYIPNKNLLIEFQGEQHFHPIKHFGGEKKFKKQIENDNKKRNYCKTNNIQLLEIAYTDYDKIEDILSFLWLND